MRAFNFLFIFLFGSSLFGQWSQSDWLQNPSIKDAHVSYLFQDTETGKIVSEYNSTKLLNPASTIKLLTSFIFLETFGESFQYETRVGYRGKIERDGTLNGDIIFQGTGDPAFASARYGDKNSMHFIFAEIGAFAQKEGITCIDGKIIVDASAYGTDCTPHNWQWNDLGNYYAAGIWAVNANENAYKLSLDRSKKSVKTASISPDIPGLYFTSELVRGPSDSGDQAYIFCAPYEEHAFVRGSVPAGKGNFSIRGSMPDAPLFVADYLNKVLEEKGIISQGIAVRYSPQKCNKVFWEHKGVNARTQVKSAIQKSINLYCEGFLMKLGKGNREDGIELINDYLIKHSVIKKGDNLKISDGSGLSQRNYISTKTMVSFLKHIKKNTGDYKKYLAKNGYSGTLKNTFTSSTLKGTIYGKSGSMDGVRAYAGFLQTTTGKELAFSIMVNNYTSKSKDIIRSIEELLVEMVSK